MERIQMNGKYPLSSEDADDASCIISDESAPITAKTVYIKFLLFCVSILLSISSYSGLIDLQSSINISDALGTRSLTLMSISTVICCLFFAPIVTSAFGAKNTILCSQVGYLLYVVSNYFPVSYVLLPGGVVLGIAEGFLYTPTLMYCTYFGRQLAGIESSKVKESVNRLVGYFWAIFQMNEILGNSISTIILNLGKPALINVTDAHSPDFSLPTSASSLNTSIVSNTAVTGYSTVLDSAVHDYSMCGADDCYNENEFDAKQDSYVPLRSTVHVMLAVYTTLAVVAIPIMCFTPSLPRKSKKDIQPETNNNNSSKQIAFNAKQMWKHFMKTLKQLILPQQLLITPLSLYHGLYVSFISSEISRAFVSCTVGVEMVGLGMFGGGFLTVFVSVVYGTWAKSNLCRQWLLAMSILLDASLYIICLLWRPSEDDAYLGLVICIVFGISDGVWSPLVDGKYAKYFSQNEEIAYSVSNLWNCVGFTMMYGWTTLLCVRVKIYIQLTVLFIGVIGLYGAELRHKKKKENTVT